MQAKRNGDISFWYADLGGVPAPRPPLPGDIEADVAIVGAGYTGLWTAYYLKKARPSLRIALIEREFAGFGASGRNGGWLSGGFSWSREKYLKTSTRQGVSAMQAAMAGCVDEVIRVASAEGIDADIRRVDNLTVATNPAQLERARAVEQQAQLNLSYTEITAPVDGTVGARSLRVGQYVQSGTQLMAVVPLDAVYVVANFKETQLTHVRNGQPVELYVDSFEKTVLKGHVDSLSPASGLEFALLPPDNATGNFTKVVQRIPVKIALDDEHGRAIALRPGMSVIPTIATRSNTQAAKAADASKATLVSGGSCHVRQPLTFDASNTGRDA